MRGAAEEYAGGIRQRARNAAIEEAYLAEELDLLLVERMARLLGADEVAHQQCDAVLLRADARRQGRRLIGGDAQSVHAGVHVQRRSPRH